MDIPEQLNMLTVQLDDIDQLFKNNQMEQAKEATKGLKVTKQRFHPSSLLISYLGHW